MHYSSLERLAARRPFFEKRAALAASLRRFFAAEHFLEVTTPSLIAAPAQEEYIETVAAADGFLRPSPEMEMKILLAAGYDRIYELGPCWRVDEFGRRHRREFTMLEYYAAGFDYRELFRFTAAMFAAVARELGGSEIVRYRGAEIDLSIESAEVITVDEAFRRYAGCSSGEGDFDELMVTRIEPKLGRGHLTCLTDYPADRAALARRKSGDPSVAERWELYIGGMELANAFSELTDEAEQRRRFTEAAAVRAAGGLQSYPEAGDFFAALHSGLPESAGCAVGFDRLAMVFCDVDDIADVQM
ncbi:MAG: hypothetical protein PHI85_02095 [Victivallaceae bacterium]|nr:hypothetical protein [Victivallaceae bacterium]